MLYNALPSSTSTPTVYTNRHSFVIPSPTITVSSHQYHVHVGFSYSM